MTRQIFSEPLTGLGNRLQSIGSLVRISRIIGADFSFSWPLTPHMPTPYDALFEESFERQSASRLVGRHHQQSLLLDSGCQVRVLTPGHLEHAVIHARAAYMYRLETGPGDPEPHAPVMREVGKILAGLRLKPDLDQRLEAYSSEFEIHNRIGIHMRYGDIEGKRRIALDRYVEQIAQLDPGVPLFVASDDEAALKTMMKRFGSRVAWLKDINRRRSESLAGQDALLEMLLLSRTRDIIAGPSSFSQVAAMIGGQSLGIVAPI